MNFTIPLIMVTPFTLLMLLLSWRQRRLEQSIMAEYQRAAAVEAAWINGIPYRPPYITPYDEHRMKPGLEYLEFYICHLPPYEMRLQVGSLEQGVRVLATPDDHEERMVLAFLREEGWQLTGQAVRGDATLYYFQRIKEMV